MSTLVEQVFFD